MLSMCADTGFVPELVTRNKVMFVIAKHHVMDFAAPLIAEFPTVPLDAVAYNTLMRGYATEARPCMCLELYNEMRAATVPPSDVTFGILIDAFTSAGQLEHAERIFDDLVQSGQEANVVHYTTFLKGLLGAGRLEDARAILETMRKSSRTKPDVITYGTIVKAYVADGNMARA